MSDIKTLFKGKKKTWLLVALGVIGVLLVIIGSVGTTKEKNSPSVAENSSDEAYIAELENKIYNVIAKITGDSGAVVVITCDGGTERVYVSNGSDDVEYVTVRTDGNYSLVLKRTVYPSVVGVSVACKGGDDPSLQKKLIGVISTALGVSSNRICIVGTK
ncbi:MAG: hypothetical protein J5860_03655 [Clostridia bacterium]|nr:hypothetical protein [Clostridia bacterium]